MFLYSQVVGSTPKTTVNLKKQKSRPYIKCNSSQPKATALSYARAFETKITPADRSHTGI